MVFYLYHIFQQNQFFGDLSMSSALKTKMLIQQLSDQLKQLETDETQQKELEFFDKFKALLEKYDYTLTDIHSMLSDVLDTDKPKRQQSSKKSAGQGLEITYEGKTYKVNSIGRQPSETKQLLDSIGMTPTEFIEQYKK